MQEQQAAVHHANTVRPNCLESSVDQPIPQCGFRATISAIGFKEQLPAFCNDPALSFEPLPALGAFGFLPLQQLLLFVFRYPALFEVLHLSTSAAISTAYIRTCQVRAAMETELSSAPTMQRAPACF
jgi:hypothetical protein